MADPNTSPATPLDTIVKLIDEAQRSLNFLHLKFDRMRDRAEGMTLDCSRYYRLVTSAGGEDEGTGER